MDVTPPPGQASHRFSPHHSNLGQGGGSLLPARKSLRGAPGSLLRAVDEVDNRSPASSHFSGIFLFHLHMYSAPRILAVAPSAHSKCINQSRAPRSSDSWLYRLPTTSLIPSTARFMSFRLCFVDSLKNVSYNLTSAQSKRLDCFMLSRTTCSAVCSSVLLNYRGFS